MGEDRGEISYPQPLLLIPHHQSINFTRKKTDPASNRLYAYYAYYAYIVSGPPTCIKFIAEFGIAVVQNFERSLKRWMSTTQSFPLLHSYTSLSRKTHDLNQHKGVVHGYLKPYVARGEHHIVRYDMLYCVIFYFEMFYQSTICDVMHSVSWRTVDWNARDKI